MKPWDVIVIGAGLNGLATAALLARAGRRVLVLEQRGTIGGLAAQEPFHADFKTPGVLPDMGSIHPQVLKALRLERYGLQINAHRSALNIPMGDGRQITLSDDMEATQSSIATISTKDAEGYGHFRTFCDAVAPALETLLLRPFPRRRSDLIPFLPKALSWWRSSSTHALLRLAPMSAKDFLDEFFETDSLKGALAIPAFQATYGGPFDAFGALSILLRETMCRTSVVGGPAAVAKALRQAALDHGVTIRTRARVTDILLSDGVRGARMDSGEIAETRTVAAACSPKVVLGTLLHHRALGETLAWRVHNLRSRGMTAHLVLALDDIMTSFVPQARLAPGLTILEHAFDRAKRGALPEHFAFEITACSDRPVLSVLVHFVPHEGDQGVLHHIIEKLASYLSGPVHASQLLTPRGLQEGYGLPGGHLFQLEMAPDQLFLESLTSPIAGLFLCGSGMRPGGSITCVPGVVAARKILSAQKPFARRLRSTVPLRTD